MYTCILGLGLMCLLFCRDKGLKVANILKVNTRDHLIYGRLTDPFCPTKLVELFAYSKVGGMAVRSRMNSFKKFGVLGFSESVGAAM